jgi:hypothetical protein
VCVCVCIHFVNCLSRLAIDTASDHTHQCPVQLCADPGMLEVRGMLPEGIPRTTFPSFHVYKGINVRSINHYLRGVCVPYLSFPASWFQEHDHVYRECMHVHIHVWSRRKAWPLLTRTTASMALSNEANDSSWVP